MVSAKGNDIFAPNQRWYGVVCFRCVLKWRRHLSSAAATVSAWEGGVLMDTYRGGRGLEEEELPLTLRVGDGSEVSERHTDSASSGSSVLSSQLSLETDSDCSLGSVGEGACFLADRDEDERTGSLGAHSRSLLPSSSLIPVSIAARLAEFSFPPPRPSPEGESSSSSRSSSPPLLSPLKTE